MRPGESWNFILTFSRTGKTWNKTVGPGKSWKSVERESDELYERA